MLLVGSGDAAAPAPAGPVAVGDDAIAVVVPFVAPAAAGGPAVVITIGAILVLASVRLAVDGGWGLTAGGGTSVAMTTGETGGSWDAGGMVGPDGADANGDGIDDDDGCWFPAWGLVGVVVPGSGRATP